MRGCTSTRSIDESTKADDGCIPSEYMAIPADRESLFQVKVGMYFDLEEGVDFCFNSRRGWFLFPNSDHTGHAIGGCFDNNIPSHPESFCLISSLSDSMCTFASVECFYLFLSWGEIIFLRNNSLYVRL